MSDKLTGCFVNEHVLLDKPAQTSVSKHITGEKGLKFK